MNTLREMLRYLWLAFRGEVALPDPAVPPADRPGDTWSRRVMADAGITPADLRWASCRRRCLAMPNRPEFDGMAATAHCRHGQRPRDALRRGGGTVSGRGATQKRHRSVKEDA